MLQAANGDLYGTTYYGGGPLNGGTVFKITPGGTLTTLYTFCPLLGCADGSVPAGALVQAGNGDLYGTTYYGGGPQNAGTVFKITPDGTLTTLYSFCSLANCTDGLTPGGLLLATNGDLYGTTASGGTGTHCPPHTLPGEGCGTVFKITPDGTLTTLYSFCSLADCTDGGTPGAPLVQATSGLLYGTTQVGGVHRYGTVFSFSVGLGR